MSIALNNMAE